MTETTMTDLRRRSMYSHSASQKQRDEREPRHETPLGKLRRRHVEERSELGDRHHKEATESARRRQHIDPKVAEREASAMNEKHSGERARLASRHEAEIKKTLQAQGSVGPSPGRVER